MPRWTDDTVERLQRAALELFAERGYEAVTVAEIAERAGLTRRTFFNHFADKREIFSTGAAAFEAHVVDHVAASPRDDDPFDAVAAALASAGAEIAARAGDAGPAVRRLVASSAELHERELVKLAALTHAVTDTLVARGINARTADLTTRAAVVVFTVAFEQWVEHPRRDLAAHMQEIAADLRGIFRPLAGRPQAARVGSAAEQVHPTMRPRECPAGDP